MKMGYLMMVAGVLLFLVGYYVNGRKDEMYEELKVDDVAVKAEKNDERTENERKGEVFEGWVVEHFNKKYFNILEWRGDKYVNGRYADSNRYPDLELAYSFKGKSGSFAVECKYRSGFTNEGITWATAENIDIYNRFEEEKRMPVFVIIGVGGEASKPERVFVVPLRKLKYAFAKEGYLMSFERNEVEQNFYYDYENNILK